MTKVLIIEDEDLVAKMYAKTLDYEGFEVVVAIGGESGLKMIKEDKPDVILLDIMMPEPNGIQVLDKIKANPDTKDIPVVVLTNLSGKHDAELVLGKGAVDFIVKSKVKAPDVKERIKSVLSQSSNKVVKKE